jgi:uncharacterized protein YqeY
MLDSIYNDINNALKAGDKKTAEALRMLLSALKNAKIDSKGEFSDSDAQAVIRKEIKKRIEARDIFANNNRPEQASSEEFERALFSQYVPEELSVNKIDEIINFIAEDLEEIKFNTLMPAVMKQIAGQADGRVVSERVNSYIKKQGS